MNDITTWFETLGREEGNDIQLQLAGSDPIVNEDENWTEALNWTERNEIKIQLADPELDARMQPIWKDAIHDIRCRFWAIWNICEYIGVQNDEAEYLLWMIDDIKSDMSVWNNNDPYQWIIEDGEEDENYIFSGIHTLLEPWREFLEKKGKNK